MLRLNTLGVCLLAGAMLAQAERQFKSQAEYNAYTDVTKDLAANNPQKALTDLDTWKQTFPDSDFKDDRTAMNVQALFASNQPAKAMDAASELMARDLSTALSGPAQQIKLLYTLAQAIQKYPTRPKPNWPWEPKPRISSPRTTKRPKESLPRHGLRLARICKARPTPHCSIPR